jgi:diguanylate cyclase (GGDEF)-like protein
MIQARHYRLPLFSKDELIAVVYIQARMPTYRTIVRMICDYSEVALANLLLHKKLLSKDVMTQLDNKHIMREAIDHNIDNQHVFFALIDIDRFKLINDNHGHKCGDKIILATAELMQTCFAKPRAISHARYGGDEFCVLFHANDENDAYDQCDLFRQLIEKHAYCYNGDNIHYTISMGVTRVRDSQHITVGNADKAISQAKGLGRNQVVLNTF